MEIGRSFILIPTPWALMSHPHWPIFPSAFVEKTTNAKDGKDCYTVSEANVVSKECCFAFTNCTVLYYFLSLYPLMADAFPRRFSHRREKGVGWGGGEKKNAPSPPLLPCPSSFWSLKCQLSQQVPARAEENTDLLFRPYCTLPGYFNRILIVFRLPHCVP